VGSSPHGSGVIRRARYQAPRPPLSDVHDPALSGEAAGARRAAPAATLT